MWPNSHRGYVSTASGDFDIDMYFMLNDLLPANAAIVAPTAATVPAAAASVQAHVQAAAV